MSTRLPAIALVLGWAALAVAWVFANPPFAAPDEDDHYVRAVSVGGGQVIGDEATQRRPGRTPPQVDLVAVGGALMLGAVALTARPER